MEPQLFSSCEFLSAFSAPSSESSPTESIDGTGTYPSAGEIQTLQWIAKLNNMIEPAPFAGCEFRSTHSEPSSESTSTESINGTGTDPSVGEIQTLQWIAELNNTTEPASFPSCEFRSAQSVSSSESTPRESISGTNLSAGEIQILRWIAKLHNMMELPSVSACEFCSLNNHPAPSSEKSRKPTNGTSSEVEILKRNLFILQQALPPGMTLRLLLDSEDNVRSFLSHIISLQGINSANSYLSIIQVTIHVLKKLRSQKSNGHIQKTPPNHSVSNCSVQSNVSLVHHVLQRNLNILQQALPNGVEIRQVLESKEERNSFLLHVISTYGLKALNQYTVIIESTIKMLKQIEKTNGHSRKSLSAAKSTPATKLRSCRRNPVLLKELDRLDSNIDEQSKWITDNLLDDDFPEASRQTRKVPPSVLEAIQTRHPAVFLDAHFQTDCQLQELPSEIKIELPEIYNSPGTYLGKLRYTYKSGNAGEDIFYFFDDPEKCKTDEKASTSNRKI